MFSLKLDHVLLTPVPDGTEKPSKQLFFTAPMDCDESEGEASVLADVARREGEQPGSTPTPNIFVSEVQRADPEEHTMLADFVAYLHTQGDDLFQVSVNNHGPEDVVVDLEVVLPQAED